MSSSVVPLNWSLIDLCLAAVVGLGLAARFIHRQRERGGEDTISEITFGTP
jgi:hypothetical protein